MISVLNLLTLKVFNVISVLGLSNLTETIRTNWIAPLFILAVGVFAVMFIKDRSWTKLISFVGIAAVIGVLLFAGDTFFGSGGSLTGTAKDIGTQIGN